MKTLKVGAKGGDVVKLQLLLNGYLHPSIKLKNDGHFGELTANAVRAFQKKRGLSSDGVVGPNTWKALQGSSRVPVVVKDVVEFSPAAPWYDIALAELGVREILGPEKNNQRILDYHATTTLGAKTDEVPWCSSFVNWVMNQSGIKGTNNALAKS